MFAHLIITDAPSKPAISDFRTNGTKWHRVLLRQSFRSPNRRAKAMDPPALVRAETRMWNRSLTLTCRGREGLKVP